MPGPALFEVLVEREAKPPRCRLEEEYGAALVIGADRVAVNCVSTIDGVVSLGLPREDSRAVGGGVPADRALMAMLRAIAGVIVVGAGTLRATLNHQWTPASLLPQRLDDLAALREASGRGATAAPLLVVSGSGDLPRDAVAIAHPAVAVHALTATGARLASARSGQHSPGDHLPGEIDASAILSAARDLSDGGPVLCEGGPHLFGVLLAASVPVDLFLTVAPQLVGRSPSAPQRRSLVEDVALAPLATQGGLSSVRRSHDHLFLRYAIDRVGEERGQG